MIKTPSKFLSVNFLRELIRNNYLSPRRKEYSAEEVIQLYLEKLNSSALRYEKKKIKQYYRGNHGN